jgi:hypothetical protein
MLAATAALLQGSQSAPPPQRQPAEGVALTYTLRMLAIPFGRLEYAVNFEGDSYRAEMHFRTRGLAAIFWKAQIDSTAEGHTALEGPIPDTYTSRSVSRSGAQRFVRVEHLRAGPPVITISPYYDVSRYPVTDQQKQGAVDPLTAMTSVIVGLNTPASRPCGNTLAVFDGRRRYDIVFTLVREEGGADLARRRVCKAEYRHIAGLNQDVVSVSSVPAIYATFSDIPTGTRRYTLAQTISSSFLWGAVTARLTEIKVDGRSLPPGP